MPLSFLAGAASALGKSVKEQSAAKMNVVFMVRLLMLSSKPHELDWERIAPLEGIDIKQLTSQRGLFSLLILVLLLTEDNMAVAAPAMR